MQFSAVQSISQFILPSSTKELVLRLGTPKNTHFGPFWNVVAKSEPMNLAYTSATLGLHLDLPFYENTPGVQVHLAVGHDDLDFEGSSHQFRLGPQHPSGQSAGTLSQGLPVWIPA